MSHYDTMSYPDAVARSTALRDRIATGILETAAALLAQRDAASMAAIAEAAGVGRATLYRYFPSREALLRALAQLAIEEVSLRIVEADLDAVSVTDGIERLARVCVAAGSKYIVLARSGQKPILPGSLSQGIVTPLRDLFRRGLADGTLRHDLPLEVLLAMFGGLLEAAIHLSTENRHGVEPASAALTKLFLQGACEPDQAGRP